MSQCKQGGTDPIEVPSESNRCGDVLTKPRFAIRLGTAEKLSLPDESVTLTVTSPPYWNAIDYPLFCADRSKDWKQRPLPGEGDGYASYLDRMRRCFAEVLRVTVPGGICVIVVGNVLYRKGFFPIPHDLGTALRETGWRLRDEIVWHKVTAASKRAGSVIRYPYPGNYYPNIVHESILIFQKPGERRVPAPSQREQSKVTIDRVFTRDTANSVWHIQPVRPRTLDHPCPYPIELPYRLIEMYSHKFDLVLDPFAGSGQTGVAANSLGRCFIGLDTEPAFVSLAKHRRDETYLRGPQHVVRWETVPTRPNEEGTP